MHPLSVAELLQAAAAAIAAGRLLQLGFARRQRALLCFLTFNALNLSALASADPVSPLYFQIYIWGNGINWIVSIFAVRELFALIFDGYPGIRTTGRWVFYGATALALAVSIAVTAGFSHRSGHGSVLLSYFIVVNRWLLSTLAVVMLAILLFLKRYPFDLGRNIQISTRFFSAVLLSEALVLVVDSLSTMLYSEWFDVTQVAFAGVCFLGWGFMLRPETEPVVARVTFGDPREHEVLRELDAINQLLTRAGRR